MTQEQVHKLPRKTERITVPLVGLSRDGGGALTVERVLLRVDGVTQVYVNRLTEMAYIAYDSGLCGPEQLVGAINSTGLRAGVPTIR